MIGSGIVKILKDVYFSILHIYTYVIFGSFTRINFRNFVVNLLLVRRYRGTKGAVVECGVWRGGMVAAIATVCGDSRKYFLFDSFEGLPDAKPVDGSTALEWQKSNDVENCATDESFAEEAMKKSGATDYQVVKGWFEETLDAVEKELPIAILRLDADWYDSTMTCLEKLYDQVVVGGIIIIDDYYVWDGCSKAIHDFLSRRESADRISQFYGRVAYIVKR